MHIGLFLIVLFILSFRNSWFLSHNAETILFIPFGNTDPADASLLAGTTATADQEAAMW